MCILNRVDICRIFHYNWANEGGVLKLGNSSTRYKMNYPELKLEMMEPERILVQVSRKLQPVWIWFRSLRLCMNEVIILEGYIEGNGNGDPTVSEIRLDWKAEILQIPPHVKAGLEDLRRRREAAIAQERRERFSKDVRNSYVHGYPDGYVGCINPA